MNNVPNLFLVQGTVLALGSVGRAPLILDGGCNANIFTTEGVTESSYIRANHATVRNGRAFLVTNGGQGWFDLLESTVTGLRERTYLDGPGRSHVTRIVIVDSAGWDVAQAESPFYFNNNRFVGASESGS